MRLALAIALALAPNTAFAQDLPTNALGRIGRGRRVSIRITTDDEGTEVRARAGGRSVSETLSVPNATESDVQTHTLAGGRSVTVVRVEGAERSAAVLVSEARGAPVVLWSDRLDPRGEIGERRRGAIEVGDRTGDGVADVVVGLYLDSTRVCGEASTLLDPRAVDPASGALRPVELRRLPEGAPELEVTLSTESPGPEGPPLLGGLAFTQASSAVGGDSDPTLLSPPVGLGDGDPATYWAEGRGGAGRWEFATARGRDGDIHAFAVVLAQAPIVRPSHFWLVGDEGPRFKVTVPADAPAGVPLWIVPEEPLEWHCVSIVLDDAGAAGAVGLADVIPYTGLDFGRGVEHLVEEIVADGARGARAADLLARTGEVGRDAILVAWPTLTPTGRRRALRILAAHSAHPPALEALVSAAADDDAEVREAAVAALVSAGDAARPALAELSQVASDAGDAAAVVLADLAPAEAAPAVLRAIDAEGGTERAALRRAIRSAYRNGDAEVRERFRTWGAHAAPGPAASVALALSTVPGAAPLASALVSAAAPRAERFEDRYRLVKAAAALSSEARVDRWLASLTEDSEEWMLRGEALAALHERGADALDAAAARALEDPYPRVRATAARVLAGRRGTLRAVATLARRDPWPMVRAAATEALADNREARPILRAALTDPAQVVRAGAVRALTAGGDRGAVSEVRARLEDEDEWPEVVESALEYARALCLPELVEPIVAVLRRGMRPDAWAPDVDSAVLAVRALGEIGGEDAQAAIRSATRPTTAGAIRAAAVEAQRHESRCEAAAPEN